MIPFLLPFLSSYHDILSFFSLLLFFLVFASETRLTMRGKILLALNQSSLGFLWNCLQIFLTVVSCYAYVHELYEDPDVPEEVLLFLFFFSLFFPAN